MQNPRTEVLQSLKPRREDADLVLSVEGSQVIAVASETRLAVNAQVVLVSFARQILGAPVALGMLAVAVVVLLLGHLL